MAKETKKENQVCCEGRNFVLEGFKIGFGFWLAGLTIALLVGLVCVGAFYLF